VGASVASHSKLTILELLKDHTGKNPFFAGVATAIAAGRNSKSADTQLVLWLGSGLVKKVNTV